MLLLQQYARSINAPSSLGGKLADDVYQELTRDRTALVTTTTTTTINMVVERTIVGPLLVKCMIL
jgi:hypothetical protein